MAQELVELQKKLAHERTPDSRAVVAREIASGFASGTFNGSERHIAIEIFRLLVHDVEKQVRKILSEQLAHSMDVPHDIVMKLAQDPSSDVSVPMLQHSYVLTEDDLIAITQSTQDVVVMSCIARRETVSRELSAALIQKSNAVVIETLLGNTSASIGEEELGKVYASFPTHTSILEMMVKRGGLPTTLAEKLFVAVSEDMQKVMTQHYKLAMHITSSTLKNTREIATLGLVDDDSSSMEIARLVDHLYLQGRLSMSMIIRSLCLGDLRFFEHALSKLADIPLSNAQLLIMDQNQVGFESLYKTCCLPMELFDATHYLLRVVQEETSFGRFERKDFRPRLADRLMQDEMALKIDYMDYLITLIQNNANDNSTAYA